MNPKYLNECLEREGISIQMLSRETGIPSSTLRTWLKGRSPNIEQLQKVAEFFNVTLDFLAFGKKTKGEALLYRMILEEGAFEITIKKLSEN